MLNNTHFYNRTIRKVVVAFGTLFNDIELIRFMKDGTPKERMVVPLTYGAKEKYLTRITSDPTLTKSIATLVPRMSFNLDGLEYDSSRKQISTLQNFAGTSASGFKSQYSPIPYNFDFSFSIYVRNTEDGTQILEQILPFFTPDFTVTVDFIDTMGQKYDMPIILNSVVSNVDYEGDMMTTRLVMWDLQFTAKGFIWPAAKTIGIIGGYNAASNTHGGVIINTHIIGTNENNAANTSGEGAETYGLISSILTQADPIDATPDEEYGFSETRLYNAIPPEPPNYLHYKADSIELSVDMTTITADRV